MKRTHHCGELRTEDIGATVVLNGWIDSVRDHGGVLFVDLRDREGITQVVFNPNTNDALSEVLHHLKPESVIAISGEVTARENDAVNSGLPTGEVEVHAQQFEMLNVSDTPPFPIDDEKGDRVNEDLRLTYRYLDLRRPKNLKTLKNRHKVSKTTRDYLDEQGFLEIETPMLFKSTPEGAREYLVPSRVNPGEFYALAQSPQQYKQMLMVAGIERYFQLARCFRDEDGRADRQPEFTQVDLEMSFIDREDMYALIEGLMERLWKEILDVAIETPFERMPYEDAMNNFGSDRPDRRFGLKFHDLNDLFAESDFKVFNSVIKSGGTVKAINAKGLADITEGELKYLTDMAVSMGAKGLAFIRARDGGEWKSPILKFFSDEEKAALKGRLEIGGGDIVFFMAAEWERSCSILGKVRLECAELLKKRGRLEIDPNQWDFFWVIEFPLMVYDDEEGRYVSAHHPFTSPVVEDIQFLDEDPKKVRGQHYDLVLNGMELGGGSIRIHQPELQQKVFEEVLQLPKEIIQDRFGYMVNAFRYGAPPHGGIALGLDRIVGLLSGAPSIRDVIAFPKTQKGQDLMSQSPGPVTERQLRDLHIESIVVDKK
ncbi:MAG: aspartate--tRNA ligase [Opitutaceae bacterium]|nr:aspartate--tRNA ligase [Opitutaceae bacterium]